MDMITEARSSTRCAPPVLGNEMLTKLMEILGIFKGEADLRTGAYSLTVAGFTLKGLRYRSYKGLAHDPSRMERILSHCFIQRGVMWQDFRRETVQDCINSCYGLKSLCEAEAKEFGDGSNVDRFFSSLLSYWANECDTAARSLKDALAMESDPIESGMDISARDAIPYAIGTLRKNVYPVVEAIAETLPADNPIRNQGMERLRQGTDDLIRYYRVSTSELTKPVFSDGGSA